jgi:hypothetical protein
MSLRSSLFRYCLSLILTFSLSVIAFADTIRLKDGSIIKGRIVSFAAGKFTVAIGEGSRLKQLTFSASEVESIVFDSTTDKPLNTASNRPADGGASVVNTSSTTTKPPPRVIVTDNTVRTNGSATIGSSTPRIIKAPAITPKSGNSTEPAVTTKPANTTVPVLTTKSGSTTNPTGTSGDRMKPISWTVQVSADNTANGWTNCGWVLKKGQRIRITGDGQISLGKGKTTTASGLGDLDDPQKLLKNVPTGALIAVIGDDNNDFIYIGAEREFTASRDGALFLGINEGNLDDNTGAFTVKVEILPDGGK